MTLTPIWVDSSTARHNHRQQLYAFGGLQGIRDDGMLESATVRPVNLCHYERATINRLAAAYAFDIATNHPFIDGNKCTAFVVSVLFVELNGLTFTASEADAATTFLALAAGESSELDLAGWFSRWSID